MSLYVFILSCTFLEFSGVFWQPLPETHLTLWKPLLRWIMYRYLFLAASTSLQMAEKPLWRYQQAIWGGRSTSCRYRLDHSAFESFAVLKSLQFVREGSQSFRPSKCRRVECRPLDMNKKSSDLRSTLLLWFVWSSACSICGYRAPAWRTGRLRRRRSTPAQVTLSVQTSPTFWIGPSTRTSPRPTDVSFTDHQWFVVIVTRLVYENSSSKTTNIRLAKVQRKAF